MDILYDVVSALLFLLSPLLFLAIISTPILWIIGEYKNIKYLRIISVLFIFPLSYTISFYVGTLQSYNYNVMYGKATKDLFENISLYIKSNNCECLIPIFDKFVSYNPKYESSDGYFRLIDISVDEIKDMINIGCNKNHKLKVEKEMLPLSNIPM